MKKSYQKIIFFEIIVILISILNSFVPSILNGYKMVGFLLILLIVFKLLCGFEKDNHRRTKDIIFELIIWLTLFYLIYYISGLFFGFTTSKYRTIISILQYVVPMILNVVLFEYLRYHVLVKCEESILLKIFSVITFIVLHTTSYLLITKLDTSMDVFIFVATILLPSISLNIVCSYLTIETGYKPSMILRLVLIITSYLIPLIPNPNAYIKAIIDFIMPVVMGYHIYKFISKYEDAELERDYHKKKLSLLIVPTLMMCMVVYFISGYFKYYAITIASGSMQDVIHRGDVVIVEQIKKDYDRLQVGDVIAFKHGSVIVVHRLIRIVSDGKNLYFYTKGDANEMEDNFKIEENKIVGIVRYRIGYIGYPTVWLNDL